MIGVVIVSHSAKLAEGVVELAMQVAQDKVRVVAAAGGIDDGEPHWHRLVSCAEGDRRGR